jgi:hypothetical protein
LGLIDFARQPIQRSNSTVLQAWSRIKIISGDVEIRSMLNSGAFYFPLFPILQSVGRGAT